MARVANSGWLSVVVTGGAAVLTLRTQINPLWLLAAGGALGGLGLLLALHRKAARAQSLIDPS